MKKILIIMGMLVMSNSVYANADKSEKKVERFEKKKNFLITMIDKKINGLSNLRNCISSSEKKSDIMNCKSSQKDKRIEMKKNRANFRKTLKSRK